MSGFRISSVLATRRNTGEAAGALSRAKRLRAVIVISESRAGQFGLNDGLSQLGRVTTPGDFAVLANQKRRRNAAASAFLG